MSKATAKRTTSAPAKSAVNKRTFIDPSTLPDAYALTLQGDCLAPVIPDGASVGIDKLVQPKAGDVVCIWFRPEATAPDGLQCTLKKLLLNIPSWVKFPHRDYPGSDVVPVLIVKQFNPERQYTIKCADILAVHKATSYTPKAHRMGATLNERDLQQIEVA